MKTNHKLAPGVLVGALIGFAGARAIHTQQAKLPPGYIIYEADSVLDIPNLQKYVEKLPETFEGEPPQGIVAIAFDSVEKAREWYESPACQAIKPIRQSASKGRLLIVEGVVPQ